MVQSLAPPVGPAVSRSFLQQQWFGWRSNLCHAGCPRARHAGRRWFSALPETAASRGSGRMLRGYPPVLLVAEHIAAICSVALLPVPHGCRLTATASPVVRLPICTSTSDQGQAAAAARRGRRHADRRLRFEPPRPTGCRRILLFARRRPRCALLTEHHAVFCREAAIGKSLSLATVFAPIPVFGRTFARHRRSPSPQDSTLSPRL